MRRSKACSSSSKSQSRAQPFYLPTMSVATAELRTCSQIALLKVVSRRIRGPEQLTKNMLGPGSLALFLAEASANELARSSHALTWKLFL